MAKSTASSPPLALWDPVILLLHMSSPIAKSVEYSCEEIVQANTQPKSDICHICRVVTWKGHGWCYLLQFHCRLASNLNWSSLKQVFITCCSSFDIVARNIGFKETVAFHFQSFECTLPFQWCKTLALKIEYTGQWGRPFSKILVFKWKWILIGLLINLDSTILLLNQDMGCKIVCSLFLSSQKSVNCYLREEGVTSFQACWSLLRVWRDGTVMTTQTFH